MSTLLRPTDTDGVATSVESEQRPRVFAEGTRPFVMIDGFNLSLEKGTGVATYARNLSRGFCRLGYEVGVLYGSSISRSQPPLLQEVLFFDSPLPARRWQRVAKHIRAAASPAWTTAFPVPITGAVLQQATATRLPQCDSIWNAPDLYTRALTKFDLFGVTTRVKADRRPAVCHWTYPLPIRFSGVPNVYTVHDLVPLRLPYTTLDKKGRYLKLLRWICRTAAHIVTVSERSKSDIVELLGVASERVTNTYQSVSIPPEEAKRDERIVQQELEGLFGLRMKDYFLFFGSLEPKKNIGRLIQAYLSSKVQTPLVIVGAQEWKTEQELKLLDAEEVRERLRGGFADGGRIFKFDYAPAGLLVSLIRGAKAVLFPSLYEGFGLPIVEAMLLGTPVLSSNTGSVPEVAGDAALLVDPYAIHEIAEAIQALDSNDALRADLQARGVRRAKLFDESSYCGRLANVYDHVLSRRSSVGSTS